MPKTDPPLARLGRLIDASEHSRRQVARDAGIDEKNLREIAGGLKTPRLDTAARILSALGKRWADLDG